MYKEVKRLGIPDSQIILLSADDYACNPRNPFPGSLYSNQSHAVDVYGQPDMEVDYRGTDVTPQAVFDLLTGMHAPHVPRSKRLLSDQHSNVLVYLTGHGGDGFLKFLDTEDMLAQDLADALTVAATRQRYHEVLVIAETCQADTFLAKVAAPNVLTLATSRKGEKSLAHGVDYALGLSQLDRFTHTTLHVLQRLPRSSTMTLQELLAVYDPVMLGAQPSFRAVAFQRPVPKVRVMDFFSMRAEDVHARAQAPVPIPIPPPKAQAPCGEQLPNVTPLDLALQCSSSPCSADPRSPPDHRGQADPAETANPEDPADLADVKPQQTSHPQEWWRHELTNRGTFVPARGTPWYGPVVVYVLLLAGSLWAMRCQPQHSTRSNRVWSIH